MTPTLDLIITLSHPQHLGANMLTANLSTTTPAAPVNTQPCACGKRHRAETICATAQRIEREARHADDVLTALRALPPGTVCVLDTRGQLAKVRTLADGESRGAGLQRP
ncbi:MAG: hypothetical protein HC828_17225, partial [Blastochloris sp.]|nr:hypothetical protein [Blastochloris sp.]